MNLRQGLKVVRRTLRDAVPYRWSTFNRAQDAIDRHCRDTRYLRDCEADESSPQSIAAIAELVNEMRASGMTVAIQLKGCSTCVIVGGKPE